MENYNSRGKTFGNYSKIALTKARVFVISLIRQIRWVEWKHYCLQINNRGTSIVYCPGRRPLCCPSAYVVSERYENCEEHVYCFLKFIIVDRNYCGQYQGVIRGVDAFELPTYGTTVQEFPSNVSPLILKEEKQIRVDISTASIQ